MIEMTNAYDIRNVYLLTSIRNDLCKCSSFIMYRIVLMSHVFLCIVSSEHSMFTATKYTECFCQVYDMDSPYEVSAMRKAFPCHEIITEQ